MKSLDLFISRIFEETNLKILYLNLADGEHN